MKKGVLGLALALVFGTVSATEPVLEEKKEVKTDASTVTWKAYKVTGGSHTGTVDLKSGSLSFDGGDQLSGGEFEVDMTTLVSTDLEGDSKGKLEGHLKSDDFFSVDKHNTSKLVFTNVKATGKTHTR